MLNLMDDISELVYVADLETYDLLYVNDSGREAFGINVTEGVKCYEALQGAHRPCAFCTNAFLSSDDTYTWEITNPVTKRHYLLKDRIVEWEGRAARIEIAFDISESENEKQQLRNALDTEHMVMRCIKQLSDSVDLSTGINGLLRALGEELHAERSYVFEIRDNLLSNTYEWCNAGIAPQIDALQNLDEACIDRWKTLFTCNEFIIIDDVEALRETQPLEYEVLHPQGISSLIAAPLERNGKLVGLVGVDNPPAEKLQRITPLLSTLRFFLSTAIQRIEDERRLTELSFTDMLTGLYNRNRYTQDLARFSEGTRSLGFTFIDLNGLKELNDQEGHDAGDAALRCCADALRRFFPKASLYRIGGDEFAAIQTPVEKHDQNLSVKDLRAYFEQQTPYRVAIGTQWAAWPSDIGMMASNADEEMYRDKRRYYRAHPVQAEPDAAQAIAATSADQATITDEYYMLMDSMRVSVSKHLLQSDFKVIWANERFYKMTGYTREEYDRLFDGHVDRYFGADTDQFLQLHQEVMEAYEAGKSTYESIIHMPQKSGSYIWIRVVGTFTDETVDGVPVLFAVYTDVTDLVQARRETSIAYDALPGFVAKMQITEDSVHLLYGNRRFLSFFGMDSAGKLNECLLKCLEENHDTIRENLGDLRAGKPVSFEFTGTGIAGKRSRFQVIANCVDRLRDDPVYLVVYIDITESVTQREALRKVAYVDPVTGGMNRPRFAEVAEDAIKQAPPDTYALVSLDLQQFKVLNDLFGIGAGDRVLRHVHRTLAANLAEGEFAARFGSDVFTLLVKNDDPGLLEARIKRIARSINSFNDKLEHKYLITIVAGVCPIDDPQLPLIYVQDRANMTRKRIKSAPGSQVCACRFYDGNDRLAITREKEIENRMADALRDGEFLMYLQPKQDLRTKQIAGAEALVRWQDSERGLISPNDFIPLFEKNGFIVDLDLYVFECACKTLRRWIDEGKAPIPISVNMSRAHLSDIDFLDRYESIRTRHGIEAGLLEIELTETLIYENPELLASIIDDIRACGYTCAMDDFGSGYSSLNVLKDIRVDVLKVDRAFFSSMEAENPREQIIIDIVLALAKRLGMETVAEGVETEDQAAFLREAGCDVLQGFLFSRPLALDDFENLAFGHEA